MGAARRKWVRRERRYSNAMWHAGWHEMKYGRFAGFKLAACLDDASRCATGAALFKEVSGENAADVLRGAVGRFGAPAAVASGSRTPGALEVELARRGIKAVKPQHTRAYGKLARFYGTVEAEIHHYESLSAYVEYYNERRLHFSLDIDVCQTPLRAFHDKRASRAARKKDPGWAERDARG